MFFAPGTEVYFIENNTKITRAVVVQSDREFSIIAFSHGGQTRLRNSRLYATPEEADAYLRKQRRLMAIAERVPAMPEPSETATEKTDALRDEPERAEAELSHEKAGPRPPRKTEPDHPAPRFAEGDDGQISFVSPIPELPPETRTPWSWLH